VPDARVRVWYTIGRSDGVLPRAGVAPAQTTNTNK
jgi:hypothetical protein